jgi:hypothetical protein
MELDTARMGGPDDGVPREMARKFAELYPDAEDPAPRDTGVDVGAVQQPHDNRQAASTRNLGA